MLRETPCQEEEEARILLNIPVVALFHVQVQNPAGGPQALLFSRR